MDLWAQFLPHQGRVIRKWAHCLPIYERHYARFRGGPVTMVKIGCGEGGSLQLWKSYLGQQATVVEVDIRPVCKQYEEDQIHVRISDQADPGFLTTVLEEFGTPDIVLDDSNHRQPYINASFDALYSHTSPTSVYMVRTCTPPTGTSTKAAWAPRAALSIASRT